MNDQLMDSCLALSSELLEKDTNSFFSNIIGYWNHIIFGDLILVGRLASNQIGQLSAQDLSLFPTPKSPQDIYYSQLLDIAVFKKTDRRTNNPILYQLGRRRL